MTQGTVLTTDNEGAETVIYTYGEVPGGVHQFQLA